MINWIVWFGDSALCFNRASDILRTKRHHPNCQTSYSKISFVLIILTDVVNIDDPEQNRSCSRVINDHDSTPEISWDKSVCRLISQPTFFPHKLVHGFIKKKKKSFFQSHTHTVDPLKALPFVDHKILTPHTQTRSWARVKAFTLFFFSKTSFL